MAQHSRALVLGGGGSTGNAWVIGVVAGLLEAGLDVTDADVLIGTSAGATAAAQLTGASAARLFADALVAPPAAVRPPMGPVGDHLRRLDDLIAAAHDAADLRRRLGAAALELDAGSDGSRQVQWRATVAARLPRQEWPDRLVRITAVDARTGDPAVFDRDSGVELVDAVAASTSSGPPYRIGEGRFIDGGHVRSSENAHLAAGYDRVLVLSPLGGRSRTPAEWGLGLAHQVAELQATGSTVETILPCGEDEHLFGAHAMDLSLRPAAARAGHAQATALGERLKAFWG